MLVAVTLFWPSPAKDFSLGTVFAWLEAYLELCQTSKVELFAKMVNGEKLLTVFVKSSILAVWQGSEYAFDDFREYIIDIT